MEPPLTAPSLFTSVFDDDIEHSFSEATLNGWAPDAGIYWPKNIPELARADLRKMAKLSYPQLVGEILAIYAQGDALISEAEIHSIAQETFRSFGCKSVVELAKIGPFDILELWHGPTLAFKDLGMAVLMRIIELLMRKRKTKMTLLVGTSGDTGSSAMEAVRDLAGLRICVLYPLPGYSAISRVQEAQMTRVAEARSHVHLVGVEGTSDDLDVPLEACFRDTPFSRELNLGSVNSINIVRLIVQCVHYIYAYLQLAPDIDKTIVFSVPCGAGGHLAAGMLAIKMGLPAKLVVATNANDALHQILSTGKLEKMPAIQTISPSMDIQMPYNLWRLLHVASTSSTDSVRQWRDQLVDTSSIFIPPNVLATLAEHISSASVSDEETMDAIRWAHRNYCYLVDPHTAVGVAAARRLAPAALSNIVVCMSCAHPVKFLSSVAKAIRTSEGELLKEICEDYSWHSGVCEVAGLASACVEAATLGGCSRVLRVGDRAKWESDLRVFLRQVAEE